MSNALWKAKKDHKAALKNKALYCEKRDNMVRQILNAETPSWGSLKLHLVNW